MHRTRSVLATGVVLGLGLGFSSVADARTGDPLREGVRNGTTTKETQIISNIGGYSTRQSNKSTTGGGAIYGCRSTSASSRPCVRANNLSTGRAFEFRTTGLLAGIITVGSGGDSTKPFTTNATGVATGLNADRVDSLSASDIVAASRSKTNLDADTVDGLNSTQLRTRWVLVNAAGEIEAQSGGFSIVVAYPAGTPAAPNVYIQSGDDLTDNGITATIAPQNQTNQGGNTQTGNDTAPDQNLEFSGEISATRCQIPGVVECGPAGAKNLSSFVVSPRLSDGQPTDADTRKRFYVQITG
ncbi:MAG: hypothetical protein H0V26_00285 [Solirubrobacterales bacterium]|nr:hypothetical protein [Solirubrobacterales bacterium]